MSDLRKEIIRSPINGALKNEEWTFKQLVVEIDQKKKPVRIEQDINLIDSD